MMNVLASINTKTIWTEIFGDKDTIDFWRDRFMPRWLPLLLGLGLGILTANLIVDRVLYLALLVVFGVPILVLLVRYQFAALIIWIAVLPYFVATPTMVERYIFWVLYRGMLPLALILIVIAHLMGLPRRRWAQFGRAELAMFIFLGLTLINVYMVGDKSNRDLTKLYDQIIVPFCLYWYVRLLAPNRKDLERLLWAGLFTLIFQCIIGLLSWFAPQTLPPQWLGLEGERTVGTLRNVAVYTSTLLFLALLVFQYGMNTTRRRLKGFFIFVFGLAYFCIFFSFSRGSWLGGSVVLIGLLIMYPRTVLGVTVVVTLITTVLGGSVLAGEMAWAYERLNNQDTANGRIIQNMASYRMISAKPWFGWGYDDYDTYSRRFKTRVDDIAMTNYRSTSHNTYLTIMSELGIPAFLLYMVPPLWWLMLTFKAWRNVPARGFAGRKLLIMLWLLLLHVFIVTNFMDMIRFHPFGTCIWWFALALIASRVQAYLKPKDIDAPQWAYHNLTFTSPSANR
jgi:O-antigen ligase